MVPPSVGDGYLCVNSRLNTTKCKFNCTLPTPTSTRICRYLRVMGGHNSRRQGPILSNGSHFIFIFFSESGRVFVWGQNQYSQLGLGSTDLCQKPSCVRTLKRLKQRVRDVRFGGNGYGLFLTGEMLYF